ncbi:MAG: hypothetical protein Q9161_001455 [Pseudevernia consocians]
MLLKSIALFAAGVTAANSGWTIPEGQPNGVYSVSVDSSGKATHTFIRDLIAPDHIEAPSKERRALGNSAKLNIERDLNGPYSITCGGYEMDRGDCDGAVANLKNQCGGGASVGGNLDYYAIDNSVVAYFCNFNSGATNCYFFDAADAYQLITGTCGLYQAGWDSLTAYYAPNGGPNYVSYGYENLGGNDFCGRGTNGKI